MNPAMRIIIAKAVLHAPRGSTIERDLDIMLEKLCIIPTQKLYRNWRNRSMAVSTQLPIPIPVPEPTIPEKALKQFGTIGVQTDIQEIPPKQPRNPFEPVAFVIILVIAMLMMR